MIIFTLQVCGRHHYYQPHFANESEPQSHFPGVIQLVSSRSNNNNSSSRAIISNLGLPAQMPALCTMLCCQFLGSVWPRVRALDQSSEAAVSSGGHQRAEDCRMSAFPLLEGFIIGLCSLSPQPPERGAPKDRDPVATP